MEGKGSRCKVEGGESRPRQKAKNVDKWTWTGKARNGRAGDATKFERVPVISHVAADDAVEFGVVHSDLDHGRCGRQPQHHQLWFEPLRMGTVAVPLAGQTHCDGVSLTLGGDKKCSGAGVL